jgi:SAM-dependent methyltransferase
MEVTFFMNKSTAMSPDFGNWVSTRLIYIPGAIGFLLGAVALAYPVLAIAAVISLLCAAYFGYARYRLSSGGGNIQESIQALVIGNLQWNGEGNAIDIGCGNAPLTIGVSKKFPNAKVTGIDYWGGAWGYSKAVCERNAKIEGVAERVTFLKASASALPFGDEAFDAAVSNLVFHEVSDVKDKRKVIQEALRVVKKGGCFVFQDLFLWKRLYGEIDDLLATIKSWGIESVEFIDTRSSEFIPQPLKLPFMVGAIGILRGRK